MIVDHLLQFTSDEGQVLSAAAASDYRVDFGQEAPTTGLDQPQLVAVFTVKADVTGTLTCSLQDSDEEGSGYADCVAATSVDSPVAGTQVIVPMPHQHKRFMQAYFGGSPTAGTVHAFITSGIQFNHAPKQAESIQSLYETAGA